MFSRIISRITALCYRLDKSTLQIITKEDIQALGKHLPDGGCTVHIHTPAKATDWLQENYEHPLLVESRAAQIGGPVPMMLDPHVDALALYGGSEKDPRCAQTAAKLAEISGFPVVSCPKEEEPADLEAWYV